MGDRFSEVKNLTEAAAAKSANVSDEALRLLIQDIILPKVDIIDLQSQVNIIIEEVSAFYFILPKESISLKNVHIFTRFKFNKIFRVKNSRKQHNYF